MLAPLRSAALATSFPGGHSGREPPDPIPNSEVKTLCADGSLAVGQVRVGHCQDPKQNPPTETSGGFSLFSSIARQLQIALARDRLATGAPSREHGSFPVADR